MRKVILTSHGHLAEGMQSAVNMILGCQADLEVYDLDHYDEPDMILERVRKRVEEQPNDEFIILTDINNGSVHHQMMQLCLCPNVYVQTGMCPVDGPGNFTGQSAGGDRGNGKARRGIDEGKHARIQFQIHQRDEGG